MSTIFIKNAKLINPSNQYHNQLVNLVIENGIISQISNKPIATTQTQAKLISYDNLHVSFGWFDPCVSLGEPGFEQRETIDNGLKVAELSGFTGIGLQPNTAPILDNLSGINFVKNKAVNYGCKIYPFGALTKGAKGTDLADLNDMSLAGAIAFGDYKKSLENSNLIKIALQYGHTLDVIISFFTEDHYLKSKGVVHEGIQSTLLGLKSYSDIAESISLSKHLALIEYTGARAHFPFITSSKSIQLIKEAKEKGLPISCSTAIPHLFLSDKYLESFDTRYKIIPPLRDEKTKNDLVKAVNQGIIDFVCSDHNPIEIENKKIEFDHALEGSIGLESAFGSLNSLFSIEKTIEILTNGWACFNILKPEISIGQKANLTLFNPTTQWVFEKKSILSKSKNSAFLQQQLKGKAIGILNDNKLVLNN